MTPPDREALERIIECADAINAHVETRGFSRSGFAPDVLDAAERRSDVKLVDLERLYEGD